MKHDNSPLKVANKFYTAFKDCRGEIMSSYYHPNAKFSDPIFPNLNGGEVGSMWQMLCKNAKDLELKFSIISSNSTSAEIHWQASYTFSSTGKYVVNNIQAKMKVVDGLIVEHVDNFSFWKRSKQAFGPLGMIIGWTPFFKKKVQNTAAQSLKKYSSKN